jgi:DNA (cytosine-5)-methyltransferase 1
VQGHLALGLDAVLRDLQGAGYRSTFGLFSAAEVGACHERKRVFVLAHSVCERGLVSFERVVSAIKDTGGESQTGRTADGWSDHTGWAIEPCVRGGDDGAANRVDRLRLLGNGVVPAVAERAFRVLLAQLFL